jgi:hypothetical protein
MTVMAALGEVALGIRFTDVEWSRWFSTTRAEFRTLQEAVRTATAP